MFTGIVAGVGTISSIRGGAGDFSMDVNAGELAPDPVIGESVALDGVCLTVVAARGNTLTFDVSRETVQRTTFKSATEGQKVNVERALRLGDSMGGHIVQGHVDCVGHISETRRAGEGYEVDIRLPAEGMKYIVEKGSIAISGVSLTVAAKREDVITIAMIPHTWEVTTFSGLKSGSTVNIEYDMISKYVENFVKPFIAAGGAKIDEEFLRRHGF